MNAVYIHIPFCNTICSYCDFCKLHYHEEFVNKYLDALLNEVKTNYKEEVINTIYIGGGTPSCLSIEQLNKLMNIIKLFKLNKEYEFSFECNVENINKEKLTLLKENGVNRLSIGVQTFNPKHLKLLNRNHTVDDVKRVISECKVLGFNNISIDLIYALTNQTIDDLKEDIKEFIKLDINHISTYSLIIEPNTKLYINNTKNIDEDLDYEMYQYIVSELKKNNFNHYETSNFAKLGYESKHNLVYWNNQEYYGFGLGASGYINNIRYENTRNLNKYLDNQYLKESTILTDKDKMEYEMILGLRKTEGVNKKDFFNKYNQKIEEAFDIKELLESNKLIETDEYIYINEKYTYLANDILVEFI